jgi:hypothetical protein
MSETYEFTLLAVGTDLQTDEALNALAEANCDDATVGVSSGVQHLDFDREAESYLAAVASAIDDVELAVTGARVVRVLPDEYVTLAEIGERTGRTRESVRLLSIGERGPGGFPPASARSDERNRLWRWSDVALWFASQIGEPVEESVDWAAQSALNALLELRSVAGELDPRGVRTIRLRLADLGQFYRLTEIASPTQLDAKNNEWVTHAESA